MDDYKLHAETETARGGGGGGRGCAARAAGQCAVWCRCDRSAAGWMAATLTLVAVIAGLLGVLAAAPATPAATPATPGAAARRTINVGSLYQGFHQIEATAVQHLLIKRGYGVNFVVDHDYKSLFSGLFDGRYDLVPSAWLPSGHQLYLHGKTLNKDYHIVGATSTDALFFFMASPAVATASSIDDLADPTKTNGIDPEIYLCAGAQTGLTIGTKKIVEDINARRRAADPSAFNFTTTVGPWDAAAKARLFAKLDSINDDPANTDKIVVAWFGPWWGDSKYIDQGRFKRMSNGKTGEARFGMPNRGVTLASRKFVESGVIDRATWGALESLYVGAKAIAAMDLQHKNAPDGTTRLQTFSDYVEAHGDLQYFFKSAQETDAAFG